MENDFLVTEENVGEVLKGFSVNILSLLEDYTDYFKIIIGKEPTKMEQYVFCLTMEMMVK